MLMKLLKFYGLSSFKDVIRDWYDGYRYGNVDVYCPWDVINDVDEIIEAVEEGMDTRANSRWYDIDRTVRAAISMLQTSPPETQKLLAKEMAKIVIDKIKEDKDIEELKRELEQQELLEDKKDEFFNEDN